MFSLDADIRSFKTQKKELLLHYLDKFVILYDGKLEGAYDTFDSAAEEAIRRFGKGPYLIRQVKHGNDDISIPASIAYRIA